MSSIILNDVELLHLVSNVRLSAELLLELARKDSISLIHHSNQVVEHFHELQSYAHKIPKIENIFPLYEFKYYIDSVLIPFQDDEDSLYEMSLSEAIPILTFNERTFSIPGREFSRGLTHILMKNFLSHYHESAQPGNPLHQKLSILSNI